MHTVSFFYKKIFIFVLSAFSVLFIIFFSELNDHRMHLVFLNVGQGDSIYIKTPENHKILIDGGPQNSILKELNEVMPFFGRKIDLMILTHPHADHLEGLIEVLKRVKVEMVLMTGINSNDPAYYEFISIIKEKKINIFFAQSDEDFIFGKTKLDVMFPFEQITGQNIENLNNSSIVIKLSYQKFSALLAGDVEVEVEKELLKSGQYLYASIYKASHHGSKTANSLEFVKAVNPYFSVIQCGDKNDYNHPHIESLINFGIVNVRKIYRTDIDGRIEFVY